MAIIKGYVQCSRHLECQNSKCPHIVAHEPLKEIVNGKSICFHESCSGVFTICRAVGIHSDWEV